MKDVEGGDTDRSVASGVLLVALLENLDNIHHLPVSWDLPGFPQKNQKSSSFAMASAAL